MVGCGGPKNTDGYNVYIPISTYKLMEKHCFANSKSFFAFKKS